MSSKIDKWADRLQKEDLVEFAIKYLEKNQVSRPTVNHRSSVEKMPQREQLVEMVHAVLRRSGDDGRLYEHLLASVRQERANRVRKREKRVIKRLDLRESVCSKLASISRATRRHESSLVEDLIADEEAVRRSESVTLKQQRKEIAEDRRGLREQKNKLEQISIELSRREQSLAESMKRLAAFEKLLKTVIECDVEDLNVQINVDEDVSIEDFVNFSSVSSPDSVTAITDACTEFLRHFGKGDHDD